METRAARGRGGIRTSATFIGGEEGSKVSQPGIRKGP